MRQEDLNTGGVRIVIILEVFRMDRWTIYNDPVWEAGRYECRAVHVHQPNRNGYVMPFAKTKGGVFFGLWEGGGMGAKRVFFRRFWFLGTLC